MGVPPAPPGCQFSSGSRCLRQGPWALTSSSVWQENTLQTYCDDERKSDVWTPQPQLCSLLFPSSPSPPPFLFVFFSSLYSERHSLVTNSQSALWFPQKGMQSLQGTQLTWGYVVRRETNHVLGKEKQSQGPSARVGSEGLWGAPSRRDTVLSLGGVCP